MERDDLIEEIKDAIEDLTWVEYYSREEYSVEGADDAAEYIVDKIIKKLLDAKVGNWRIILEGMKNESV